MYSNARWAAFTSWTIRRILACTICGSIFGSSIPLLAQNSSTLTAHADGGALDCPSSTCRGVPFRERLTTIGTKNVRGIVGGFAQGSGLGGGAQLTTDRSIPRVIFRANLLASTKFARRADLESFVPSLGSDRNHADFWFSYSRSARNYFGIGPREPRDFKSDYSLEQRSVQTTVYRELATSLQAGVYVQMVDSHSSRGRNKTDPPIGAWFSADPAVPPSQWAPGLFSYSKILSYGGYVLYDTRDNAVGLTRGMQIYGRMASYDGLKNGSAFEDYGWNEAEIDARGYIPVASSKTSLAARARGQFKGTKGGSQIPFYDLSWLGGREYVRGYETYRFHGENVLMFATELRRTVHTITDVRGIDIFTFAESGQVWGDSRSLTDPRILQNDKFSASNWHSGVGVGVQYRRSRHFAGRLEVGRSNEGVLIYVSMTRGF